MVIARIGDQKLDKAIYSRLRLDATAEVLHKHNGL